MATTGEKIRQARLEAVLTQVQLAEAVGLDPATLSRIESGHVEPRLTTIQRIAKTLDVDPRTLRGD